MGTYCFSHAKEILKDSPALLDQNIAHYANKHTLLQLINSDSSLKSRVERLNYGIPGLGQDLTDKIFSFLDKKNLFEIKLVSQPCYRLAKKHIIEYYKHNPLPIPSKDLSSLKSFLENLDEKEINQITRVHLYPDTEDKELALLRLLPNIKKLSLEEMSEITNCAFEHLSHLSQLNELSIKACEEIDNLDKIPFLPSLCSLEIDLDDRNLGKSMLSFVTRLPSLQKFRMSDTICVQDLHYLTSCKSLRKLYIDVRDLTFKEIRLINQFPFLHLLFLDESDDLFNLPNPLISEISNPSIKKLVLPSAHNIDLTLLSEKLKIEKLTLNCLDLGPSNSASIEEIKKLSLIKTLKKLVIIKSRYIQDKERKALEALTLLGIKVEVL